MLHSDLYRRNTIGVRLKLYVDDITKPALGMGGVLLILCGIFYLVGALDVIHAARAVLWYLGGTGLLFLAIVLARETMALVRTWPRGASRDSGGSAVPVRSIGPDAWWLHPGEVPVRGRMDRDLAQQLQRGRRQHRSARRARRLRPTH